MTLEKKTLKIFYFSFIKIFLRKYFVIQILNMGCGASRSPTQTREYIRYLEVMSYQEKLVERTILFVEDGI